MHFHKDSHESADVSRSPLIASMEFQPYSLGFVKPLNTARGPLDGREGVIVRLSNDEQVAFADLVPLPHFGTESLDEALEYLRGATRVSDASLKNMPEGLVATRFALEVALSELSDPEPQYFRDKMPVSKLLPPSDNVYSVLANGIEDGFTIFKMKIGIADFDSEMQVVLKVLSQLPEHARLRIDANEGLDVSLAKRWLGSLEGKAVDFVEQPLQRTMVEEIIGLSEQFETEIALDESIATTQDMIDCYEMGFRGVFASKPMRFGEYRRFIEWRDTSEAKISYSTIFESGIGSIFGIRLAATDKRNTYGLGFGVSHFYKSASLILPSAPFYTIDDLQIFEREKIWELLSRK